MGDLNEPNDLRAKEWESLRNEVSRKQDSCERIKIGVVASILAIYAFAVENRSWENGRVHSLIVFGGLPTMIAGLGYFWILTHRFSVVRIALYLRTPSKDDWEMFLRTDTTLQKARKGEGCPCYVRYLPEARSDGIICGSLFAFSLVATICVLAGWEIALTSDPGCSANESTAAQLQVSQDRKRTANDEVGASSSNARWLALAPYFPILPFMLALAFIGLHCRKILWQIKTVDHYDPPSPKGSQTNNEGNKNKDSGIQSQNDSSENKA